MAKITCKRITVTPREQPVLLGFCSSCPVTRPGWHRGALMALKELADEEGAGTQIIL